MKREEKLKITKYFEDVALTQGIYVKQTKDIDLQGSMVTKENAYPEFIN